MKICVVQLCPVCEGLEPCSHDFDAEAKKLEEIFGRMGCDNPEVGRASRQPLSEFDVCTRKLMVSVAAVVTLVCFAVWVLPVLIRLVRQACERY